MTPFAPSAAYYARRFAGEYSAKGLTQEQAGLETGARGSMRTLIAGDVTLSVPVEGGASALKRRGLRSDTMLSGHGRWQQVHLGAWRAAYGKSPYFIHLFPALESIYLDASHDTAAGFNNAIDRLALSWLRPEVFIHEFNVLKARDPRLAAELIEETKTKINYSYSIFDAIFRLGKNTMFGLTEHIQTDRIEER